MTLVFICEPLNKYTSFRPSNLLLSIFISSVTLKPIFVFPLGLKIKVALPTFDINSLFIIFNFFVVIFNTAFSVLILII